MALSDHSNATFLSRSLNLFAAVYHDPEDIRFEEVKVPEISPEEVLVKVDCASICGTDLRILHGGHRKYPPGTVRIPGHELSGVIALTGKKVKSIKSGERVFIAPNMGCGHCRQCISGNNNLCANYDALGVTLDGAFAEYVRIPAQAVQQGNLMPIAVGLDASVAALVEPFACVLRGQNALKIQPGDTVLVMGAGPIGTMHLLLARLRGASRVVVSEPHPDRRAQAKNMGADWVVDPLTEDLPAILDELTQGQGADGIVVATPVHQAQESALKLAAIGGRINYFGGLPKDRTTIQFDSNIVHYKELMVTGTTACSTADCRQAVEIVNSGCINLSPLVSARYPLSHLAEAFAAAQDGKSLKIVLEP
jgi:L-iditol 2-dehydrogenase